MNNGSLTFEKVHEAYRSKIEHYLAHLVGESDAEDLTQEVFIRVNRALASFRGESQVSTWIYRIASNAAIDKMRNHSLRLEQQTVELEQAIETDSPHELMGEQPSSPEDRIFNKERYECFIEYVKNLPLSYRAVLVLSELEDMKNHQIAEILGLSLDTVKIRLHRSRARLLQELKENCNPEDWL